MKGKIIGWYEDGHWTFGQVNGRFFERKGNWGSVDVEIMGGTGWEQRLQIGYDRCILVRAGKVWVWFEKDRKWRKCGK